ncbi:Bromodomain-containing protein [Rhizophagus irregularis]|uniref:Bromodomain-containing protein n=1 Tax=Rhizophagus irregularis TaxID=588596 RepID=A0A2I1GXT6_9GLOM|nr:Bromodomain-containing protein [Rhizophagus irregularis]
MDFWIIILLLSQHSQITGNLDNAWATHFLEEAEKLNFDQKVLKKKVNTEHLQHRKILQFTIILVSAKDFSKTSQQKDIELINFCYDILHELENKSCALPFKCIKKKDMIIKHPMDLSTINLKLKNNQYKSLEGFEKDIRLIFCNCYTYNEAGSEICYLGEVLESVFNKKWIEKITHQVKQRDELKRVRDDADIESEHWKKQCRILE